MNNLFHENKKNLLLFLGLLFVLLIVLFFLLFQPLSKELKSTENQVNLTKNEVEILKEKAKKSEDDIPREDEIDRLKYARQMPMTPETEDIILMLEEIEFVSSSRIENVGFSYDGSIPERNLEMAETEDSEEKTEQEVVEEEEEQEIEPVIDMEEKPENLHVITVSVNVSSPDYEHYQTFLKEIEKQERMMMVSSMDFEKRGEQELLFEEDPDESIRSNITITTFYYK